MTEPLDPSLSFAAFLEQQAPAATEVADDDWANAKLARLSALTKAIRKNDDFAAAQIERVKQWRSDVNSPLQNEADSIQQALSGYALAVREQDDRATVKLPWGVLKTTAKQPAWVIEDSFEEWARTARPDLIKTTYSVDRRAAKAAFILDSDGHALDPKTGEVVPGLSVVAPGVDSPAYFITITPAEQEK